MVREFKLPDVGEGVAEGELISWLVAEGDPVMEDQPVAEVETDKALVEVPAPVDGTVADRRYEEGDIIPVGEVFITFDVDGEETAPNIDAKLETETAADELAGDFGVEPAAAEPPQDRVFAPPRVRRLARQHGIDLSALEGSGPGGRITAADLRAAVDTPAKQTESGQADVVDAVELEGSPSSAERAKDADEPKAQPELLSSDLESGDRDRTLAVPATRRIAREAGIDINAIPPTDERDGEAFVTPEAVLEYAEAQKRAQEADSEAISGPATATSPEPGERERREPLDGVRKRIAETMVESKYTAPHVTHHDEVDVTALVETRKRLTPRADDQGVRLTYMPFITKAVVAALKQFPEMNALIDDETDEIVYREYYNIGVATATDAGLMVPVLENADKKGLVELASETNELVEKARERTISPEKLQGSTFTITNVGGIGGEYATPILNYPEAGIIAVGEIKRKPRVVTDEDGTESIEPRSVLTLSLSFDHRLIDGAVGARFTNTVMEYLENPELLLLE